MKKISKFLSVLLSLCMLTAFLPAVSLAAGDEAYAVYDGTAKTLTFCVGELQADGVHRDAGGDPVSGDAYYTGFLTNNYSMMNAPWSGNSSNVTAVTFLDTVAPVSTAYWFCGFSNLTVVQGVDHLDTSAVTNMEGMFESCSSFTALDLRSWNTANVTSMGWMFSGCSSLTSLNVSGWDTANVDSMFNMFSDCSALTSLDLSSWDTGKVKYLEEMLSGCSALASLDLSGWNTGSVVQLWDMFYGCTALSSLTLGEDFSFYSGTDCALPDVPNDSAYTGKWINLTNGMKKTSQELTTSYNGATMAGTWVWEPMTYAVYDGTAKTLTFCVGGLEADGVHRAAGGDPVSGDAYYTGFLTDTYVLDEDVPWNDIRENVTAVTFLDTISPKSTAKWFHGFSNLAAVQDAERLDTSNVTNMSMMFTGCQALTSLDLSSWNTGKVTDMFRLFSLCTKLTSLNVSSWDTGSVTMMNGIFYNCSALSSLDVGSWDTGSATDMSLLFRQCSALTSLDLSSWDTDSVTEMSNMFNGCESLQQLNVSGFNTAGVTAMKRMFEQCSALQQLDLSSFVIGEETNTDGMFYGCDALSSLKLGAGFRFNEGHSQTNDPDNGEFVNACLPDPPTDTSHTGKWIRESGEGSSYTAEALMDAYDGATMADTWVWESAASTTDSQAYAVYNSTAGTLTFCVGELTADGVVRAAGGDPVSGDEYYTDFTETVSYYTETSDADLPWYDVRGSVETVVFLDEIAPKDTAHWFNGFSSLTSFSGLDKLNTGRVVHMGRMFFGCSALQQLDLGSFNTGSVLSMHQMFSGCTSLQQLNVSSFNTANVTNMGHMFQNCSSLQQLDLSNFNTANVTTMGLMFAGCSALQQLDLSSFNTAKAWSMGQMFYECRALQQLDVSSFNTASATGLGYMFKGCSSLQQLDVSNFNTANVTRMEFMFYGCASLQQLDLSNFNTEKVTNMDRMFRYCTSLQQLNVSSFNTAGVTNMKGMFYYCSALQQLDLSNFNTAGVTQMQGMFCNCTALQRLDLSSFVIGEETNTDGMLYHCNALFSLKLGAGFRFNDGHSQTNNDNPNAWDIGTFVNACLPDAPTDAAHTGKWIRENGEGSAYTAEALMDVYDGTTMADTWVWQPLQAYAVFNGTAGTLTFCVGGLEADGVHRTAGGDPVSGDEYYTGFLTDTYTQQESVPWRDNRENVTTVTFLDTVAPVSTASWFSGFTNLTAVNGIDHLDTSSVTNMAGMFSGCSSLTSLDVSGWDTGSVTSMSSVFAGCSALTSLDVGSWNTGSVTDMCCMFKDCPSLTSLDVSGWDTGSVTNMGDMFAGCSSLNPLDVGSWNTGSVTQMYSLFQDCSALTALDVGSWETGSVTQMYSMFSGCSSLTSLNVSSWDTGSVSTMFCMFNGCSSLTALNLGSWDTGSVTNISGIFSGCSALAALTLGEDFSFVSGTDCNLPDVPNDSDYTGKWINQTAGLTKTSQELMTDYNGATMNGTWVWQPRIDISGATISPIADQTYTGEALTPAVTVTLADGTVLVPDTDYTVEYGNNTNKGTATVTVTGNGNYAGTLNETFEITAKSLDGATVSPIADQTYTGEALTPAVTVTLPDGTVLVPDTDYTVEYGNNTNAGTATVTVTGNGNYAGTLNETFEITAKSLDGATVTVADQTYTGEALTPDVTVTLPDGTVLVPDTDYTVEYGNNTNKGTATVTVTGNGNYAGTLNETFEITAKSLDGATVTVADQTYTGEALTPDVTVTLPDGTVLTPGTDYTVEYSNNTDPGTATVTVTGNGNYAGTLSESFEVTAYDISDASVTADKQKYTGEALTPAVKVELSDGTILTEGTDYTVEYSNNTEPGRANITVTGKGFYTGTAFGTFTITDEDEPIDSEELFKQSSILDLLRKLIKAIVAFFKKFC